MTKRVWLAQMKCPGNHTILAAAREVDSGADEKEMITALQSGVDEAIDEHVLNPWCGLCGAKAETWTVDLRRTAYATIEEAMPALAKLEAENILAGAVFGDIHRTQKPN